MRQIIEDAVSHKIDVVPVIAQEDDSTIRQSGYKENLRLCHPVIIDSDDIAATEMSKVFDATEYVCDSLSKLDDKQYGYHCLSSFLKHYVFRYLDQNACDE